MNVKQIDTANSGLYSVAEEPVDPPNDPPIDPSDEPFYFRTVGFMATLYSTMVGLIKFQEGEVVRQASELAKSQDMARTVQSWKDEVDKVLATASANNAKEGTIDPTVFAKIYNANFDVGGKPVQERWAHAQLSVEDLKLLSTGLENYRSTFTEANTIGMMTMQMSFGLVSTYNSTCSGIVSGSTRMNESIGNKIGG